MKKLEIERKFLLRIMPGIPIKSIYEHGKDGSIVSTNLKEIDIYQFYMEDGRRYRRSTCGESTNYYLTIKKEISHGVFEEDEMEISENEYTSMEKNKTRFISKRRYVINYKDDLKWEIDDYKTCKMVTMEIELPTIDHPIEIPDWLQDIIVMEVTGMKPFSNFNLSTKC